MKNVLPFCNDSSIPFSSPSSCPQSQRRSTNIAVPLCWPLPQNHTVTLPDDIPFPQDVQALQTTLASLHCRDSTWLTGNPVLSAWIAAVNSDPTKFAASSNSFFSLNKSPTLDEYQVCISICRSIIADHLLARGKAELTTAIIADPSILVADSFPPSTIDPATLCPTSLLPALPWIPSFPFHPPSTASTVPQTLTTTAQSVASRVSTSSLTTASSHKKAHPSVAHWMCLLMCEFPSSPSKRPPLFQSAPVTFNYSPLDPSATIPSEPYLLSPLHETFEALVCSKHTNEACSTMAHRFELSRSSAIPNVVTEYLLHCGPKHGPFFSTQVWDLILSSSLCAAPLSPTPYQGFSPLITLLLDPELSSNSSLHPQLPSAAFTIFREVLCFIHGCKWFLMTVGHPQFYKLTIIFQALSYLESRMTSKNLAAK